MTIHSLSEIDKLHSCAAKCVIHRHRIMYPELGVFATQLNKFKNNVTELSQEPYWQKYFNSLKRIRFDMCATPLLTEHRNQKISEVYSDLNSHLKNCHMIYPEYAPAALSVLNSLKNVSNNSANLLVDKLLELAKPYSKCAWVIKESRFIPHIEHILAGYPEIAPHVEIVHHTRLTLFNTCYDVVNVIGSPIWFPDKVFTAPRAIVMNILQYEWMHDSWNPPETFIAQYTSLRPKEKRFKEEEQVGSLQLPAESVLLQIESQELISAPVREPHRDYEEIEARCVLLEGETAIFFEADESSKILVIDLEEDEDCRVRSINISALQPGAFVLVRRSGGGDYLVPVADEIMGNKAQYARECQADWKKRLREYVIKHNLFETSIALLELGSDLANEINVRNWMYSRSIKTRKLADFAAIMRLIGLEGKTVEYWKTMQFINSAHRKAGYKLKSMLLSQVDNISPEEFYKNGKIEFKLAEDDKDTKLTAYRVETLLPQTYNIAFSRIGIPFKIGE